MKRATIILFLSIAVLGPRAFADIDFSDWHTPAEVYSAMDALAAAYPTLARVQSLSGIIPGGQSVHNRPIKVIKISDNVLADDPDEGDVIFVGAHHAREWISIEMSLYLAEYLLQHYSTNASLRADIDRLEIWIVPIVNPDGVYYSWTDPTNDYYREWRKNRRINIDGSRGVDLNRNWGYEWNSPGGSSLLPPEDTYRGPFAFSEPEVMAIRDFAKHVDNLKFFISYHSYSQLFLRPWSYTWSDPPGESTLKSISDRSRSLISGVHGEPYSDYIWYLSSGEATDWFWGEMRVAAFTPELRPTLYGGGGFQPPPSTIIPSNEENIPPALALIHDAGARELWIKDYPGDTGHEPSAVRTPGGGWSRAFWVSPDIWTVPEALNQGATVDLKVRIHNDTGGAKTNVRLDVYFSDPGICLEWPSPTATLIGTQTLTVPSGGTVVTMPWTTPVGNNSQGDRHWCVGAVVKHANDLPLTTQAQRSSNIGMKNFRTTNIVVGSLLMVAGTNLLQVDAELVVSLDRELLPKGWKVFLPDQPERKFGRRLSGIERKAELLGAKGMLLEPGQRAVVPIRVEPPDDAKPGTTIDLQVHGVLVPLVAGERKAVGNGYTYRIVVPDRIR